MQIDTVAAALPQWTDARSILKALRMHSYDTHDAVAWAQTTAPWVSYRLIPFYLSFP